MMMLLTGRYIAVPGARAFLPNPLPPVDLDLGPVQLVLDEASHLLGELNGTARKLANPHLVIKPLTNREALATSRMEGTVTSLDSLYLMQAGISPASRPTETRETLNYVRAFEAAIDELQTLPVCSRLLKNAHRRLMAGLPDWRGGHVLPGEFKSLQNHIGRQGDPIEKARFVPCPPTHVNEIMSDLEKYINSELSERLPPLVVTALVHYQFETIHPFPDSNGRVGRLLIPLLLMSRKRLSQPLLYVSPLLEANKERYVDLLLAVSMEGKWLDWLQFFLETVALACREAIDLASSFDEMHRRYREEVSTKRASSLLLRLVESLFAAPVLTIPTVVSLLGISYPAARKHVERLREIGILRQLPGPSQPMAFFAPEIMTLLNDGRPTTPRAPPAGQLELPL